MLTWEKIKYIWESEMFVINKDDLKKSYFSSNKETCPSQESSKYPLKQMIREKN